MKKLLAICLSLCFVFALGGISRLHVEAVNLKDSNSKLRLNLSSYKRFAKRIKIRRSNIKHKRIKSHSNIKKSTSIKKSKHRRKSKGINIFNNNKIKHHKTSNTKKYSTIISKIKGDKQSKLYYLPGNPYYNSVPLDKLVYFSTEQEAINAGYKKDKGWGEYLLKNLRVKKDKKK
jgi:prophage lp1 protein 66